MSLLKRFQPRTFSANDQLIHFGAEGVDRLPRTLRCLVWNMAKARHRHWWNDFHTLTHDKDLVLLQEAVANAPSDAIFSESERFHWLMVRSHQHPVTNVLTGVKTGGVAKPISSRAFMSPHREPLVNTQKTLLATHYAVDGLSHSLLVLNVHAINFVSATKFKAQMTQVESIVVTHEGPVLLAGDFNTWSSRRRLYFEAITRNCSLNQAQWHRRSQLQHLHQHLDHVYFRSMRPMHVESLQHIRSSDHKPIAVTFRL